MSKECSVKSMKAPDGKKQSNQVHFKGHCACCPVQYQAPPGQRRNKNGWEVSGSPFPVIYEGSQGRSLMIGIYLLWERADAFHFPATYIRADIYLTPPHQIFMSTHPELILILGITW